MGRRNAMGGSLDLFVGIATAIYVVVGTVIGVRLLLLAQRTRGFPELALGLGEVLLAGFVPPLFAIVQLAEDDAWIRAASFGGHLCYTLGSAVMILFTWRVFRERELWSRVLALAMVAVLVAAGAMAMSRAFLVPEIAALREPQTAGFVLMEWISVAGFLWTAIEAFRLWARLRKQAALGLVDPVVVNRILLWGFVGLAGLLAAGAPLWAVHTGHNTMFHAPTRLLCAIGTLVSSVFIQLAFLPTQRYLRWVRAGR
jgi:hypothetical protein